MLKEAVLIATDPFELAERLPLALFRVLADHEINLAYVTCVLEDQVKWRVNMVVDYKDMRTACRLMAETLGKRPNQQAGAAILSVFPHRKKPAITGALFKAFSREGIHPGALAHSPSAISAVVKEEDLLKASSSLFGPFAFGAYRTPAEWKMAQEGKEKLYKEVVATYQEKHPKVYGLEYQEYQELLHITLEPSDADAIGTAFEEISQNGLDLTFLVASRSPDTASAVDLCLPLTKSGSNKEKIAHTLHLSQIGTLDPVGTFSMNGPHFGDRYGIVRDLLSAFETAGVDLLGLSCTIASITGVVPSSQLSRTIEAIQNCFVVPSVLKIERKYD